MNSNNNSFQNKLKTFLTLMSVLTLIVLFQNCDQNSFQSRLPGSTEQFSEDANNQSDLPSENFEDDGLFADIRDVLETPQNDSTLNSEENSATGSSTSFISAATTSGNNYYVATTGNDANPGTLTKPCKTIQCAANKASKPGDIINVRKGTYKGKVWLRYPGSSGKPIILRSYPGERAIIDQGPDVVATKEKLQEVLISNIKGYKVPIGWLVIENLDIVRGYNGIRMYAAHDVVIRNCKVLNSFNQGIIGSALRLTVTNNTIAFNGYMFGTAEQLESNKTHGIYMSGSDHKITNNVFHSNLGYGVQMSGNYYPNNHAGPQYGYTNNWLISNNTFALQRNRSGIVVWASGATNSRIINNIFYNNANQLKTKAVQGVAFVSPGAGHVINNNLFFSSQGHSNYSSSSKYTASKNVNANPLFVNPAKFDFRLSVNSPALKMGAGAR